MRPFSKLILPILLAAALLTGFTLLMTASRAVVAAPADSPLPAGEGLGVRATAIFAHLNANKRLHIIVDSPAHPAGTFVAPDDDWTGGGSMLTSTPPISTAWALRSVPVAVFRTTVTDTFGQDVASWGIAYMEDALQLDLGNRLRHTVLTEADLIAGELADYGILILPEFNGGYVDQVAAALTEAGLNALNHFVQNGGTVYAQGTGMTLLEAAGLLTAGTLNPNTPLELPHAANSLGALQVVDSTHLMAFNWEADSIWVFSDPAILVAQTSGLQTIAVYSNTVGGPQPAIVYGEFGQGRVVLVAGHPTYDNDEVNQLPILINGLLTGMAEKAELSGQAIQTYDGNVAPDVIPAYEAGIPISVTLCVDHLWDGGILEGATLTERVWEGFRVDEASITPTATAVTISNTTGITITTLTWNLGDLTESPPCIRYTALSEIISGTRKFSQGELVYTDSGRTVTWAHPDFNLEALMPARILGQHDKERDRFFYMPEEGLILDEFVFLENKEENPGYNLQMSRYIPLIVPVVGLEDQREPLATNAGATVWMSNTLFMFENGDYPLPANLTSFTDTLSLDDWDGTTYVTMTTPRGYHQDPRPTQIMADGFFVTIPPTYTHAIKVTADGELLLPAIRVDWDLGDFPGFWYEMPAVRYGILSKELFGRSVSFTGDPLVGTVVVDATGGSVYTGLGSDPLIKREFLAEVLVQPPAVPDETGLTYQDVWSRTHELELRAGFYDLFNWATCQCGPWIGETHQRLNVTFGIWVDTDGDNERETLITDFDTLKGLMPTRVRGNLDIMIKTKNQGTPVGADENYIEARIFKGLNFAIRPATNQSWYDSYTAQRSELISQTTEGAYDYLIFQQSDTAAFDSDTIVIHAEIDATTGEVEKLLKLHDGASFVYRQGFAGPGQYEVHDTHVQAVLGARSDAAINSQPNPVHISTYSDTVFTAYEIWDEYEPRAYDIKNVDPDVYLQSWGYGDTAATSYVGGRDGRVLYSNLVELGDRTIGRIEVNNNSGTDWANVSLTLNPPPGITVTLFYTDNAPVPMWPDLPFLHVTEIPDTSYGIYYYLLEIDPAAVDLQGEIVDIPVSFSAEGADASFEVPPLKIGVRSPEGDAPIYASGTSSNLQVSDRYHPAFHPQAVYLLTENQRDTLWTKISDDKITGTTAISYLQNLSTTFDFIFADGLLSFTLPVTAIPLQTPAGISETVYAVAQSAFTGTRATRYQISQGATLTSVDDFGMTWQARAGADNVEASGASLEVVYQIENISNTLRGRPIEMLETGADNLVEVQFTIYNHGTDVADATETTIVLTRTDSISVTSHPANVSYAPNTQTLVWDVGKLAPGSQAQITVTFLIHPAAPAAANQLTAIIPEVAGYFLTLINSDASFINTYTNASITARVGAQLSIPYGKEKITYEYVYLPLVLIPVQGPDLIVSGAALFTDTVVITITNQGNQPVEDGFWVDLYIDPNPVPTQVNQMWHQIAAQGLAWGVAAESMSIAPGESFTLTVNGPYYQPDYSRFYGTFAENTPIYVQVDSYSSTTNYGAIQETHEKANEQYNNIAGPFTLTASHPTGTVPETHKPAADALRLLPERPRP